MKSETMRGKVVLITGATSGIGKATAVELADMGATVVIIGRDLDKGKRVTEEIASATGNQAIDFIKCDLASLDEVKKAASEFMSRYQHLDVLIDNAGGVNGKRKVTIDGYEYTFGVNHLAHFLLTDLLLDLLKASAPSRIVVVSSAAHTGGHIDFEDLMREKRYGAFTAYSQSKLANALFAFELARRLEGTGVTANAVHPGGVRTNFGKGLGRGGRALFNVVSVFMISAKKGAQTSIYLASSPEVANVTGRYFAKRRVKEPSPESKDEVVARRLWEVSEQLTKRWLS